MSDYTVSNKLNGLKQLNSLAHFYHGFNTPFSLQFDVPITSFGKLMKINDLNSTEKKYLLAGLLKDLYHFSSENTREIPCLDCS